MAWLRKLLMIVVLILGLVLGVWLSTENTQLITVSLLGFLMPPVSVGLLICGLLLVGALLGFLVSMISGLKVRNEKLSLRRQLSRCEKELDRLRKSSVKS